MRRVLPFILIAVAVILALAYFFLRPAATAVNRVTRLREFFQNPAAHPDWQIHAGERCPGAPF